MNTVNALVAQSRDREVARAARHPSRLMAHELRRARTTPAPAGGPPPARRARSVLVASGTALTSSVVLTAGLVSLL